MKLNTRGQTESGPADLGSPGVHGWSRRRWVPKPYFPPAHWWYMV